jgi:FAD/FMN-containing dehydrogenase/pimeloyl-ACP methyl ester carboxylesterase
MQPQPESSIQPPGDGPRARLVADLPVRQHRIDTAGISTAVLAGGEGPPLVLLHGPGESALWWMRVIPDLVRTHRVVAPDLPGHGDSAVPKERLEPGRVLDWLDEVIEVTCPSPPVLIGHALGGAIATRYAVEHGDRLAGLVLVDSLGLAPFRPDPRFAIRLARFMLRPTAKNYGRFLGQCMCNADRLRERMGFDWAPFLEYNLARMRDPGAKKTLRRLMGLFGARATPPSELARIDVPTALIWGRDDRAVRLRVATAAHERYGWPLHVIDQARDDPKLERPKAFLEALRTVLPSESQQQSITVTTLDGAKRQFPMDALDDLRRRIGGEVLLPSDGDAFVEATLLWNGMIEKTPAFVARPRTTEDVVASVDFAREHGLSFSVKGGGHNIAGTALTDGGFTLDMSRMRNVEVNVEERTVRAGAGCLLQHVDRVTQEHGLATVLGFISETGIAGLTLGGGFGYLARRFGWAVDNLLEVEIVTADGRSRRASRDENADLFWGIRGAGANLGVVTSFTYRLHEVGPMVHGGLIAWPFERADEVLRAYRDITAAAPRELTIFCISMRAPPAPFVPEAWHGKRICAMVVCHSGDLARADEVLAPIHALGDPVVNLLRELPYVELQSSLDATEPKGKHYYWKTEYAADLSDEMLETMRERFADCPIHGGQIVFAHIGGALNERAADDGAIGNRDVHYAYGVAGMWEPGEPKADVFRQWLRDAAHRIAPFSTGASYINFQTADEAPERVLASYGKNYERLARVKATYDPGNLFRSNRNVAPAR